MLGGDKGLFTWQKEFLHEQCVLITCPVVEPFVQRGVGGVAKACKEADGNGVGHGHNGVELMEVKGFAGIVFELLKGCGSIAFPLMAAQHHNAHLCALVAGVEVSEVGHAHYLALGVFHHEAHLSVGVDVACLSLYEVT